MRVIRIDPMRLGFSADEVAIAGRVALAVRTAARAAAPELGAGKRSTATKMAVADALLRAGGWQPQDEASRKWRQWLREARRCTVREAHEARMALGQGTLNTVQTKRCRTQTAIRLAQLEEQGVIRYVRADHADPGLVVWIGDAP
jgi:hypothetical protein